MTGFKHNWLIIKIGGWGELIEPSDDTRRLSVDEGIECGEP